MASSAAPNGGFRERIAAGLAETPPKVTLERDSFYSQPEWDVYRMHYDSSGGHRLFAWLSIPKEGGPHGDGTFPALVRMPDYASVHDIIYTPLRQRAVVMNATHRGQRNSDHLVKASYPGLLTAGIESADPYALLGAYADAWRALDALEAQSAARIGAVALTGAGWGASLALWVAAQRPTLAAVAADTPLALGHPAALEPGRGYPLGELGDYLRAYPQRRDAVAELLAPVNPVQLAPSVSAPVLLSVGRFDRSLCPLAFGEDLAAALPNCELRVYDGGAEGGGHVHAQARLTWLTEQLAVAVS